MRLLLGLLFAFAVAAVVGLGATWFALTRGTAFGALTIGAWTAWPKTGTADIDPYARASIARSGELPIGSGDGVAFFARTDDDGRALDGRCDVVALGHDAAGALLDPDAVRSATARLVANAVEPLRLHQPGDRAQRRRQLRDRGRAARAARQLAADRRHRALLAGAAPLRHAGRRRDAHRTRSADARDRHAESCP